MEQHQQAERLPLWRNVAEHIEHHHKPGDLIETSWLLEKLRIDPEKATDPRTRESMRFGIDVASIRRYLETCGMYLSGQGLKGEKFQLLLPRQNINVMQAYTRAALDKLNRCLTLGNATDRTSLTTEEAAKHESYLAKTAARVALMGRRNPEKIVAETAKAKPKALPVPT